MLGILTKQNQDSDQSKERHSKPSWHELKVEGVSSTPGREALVDHAKMVLENETQDSKCFDSPPMHTEGVIRSPLQNHDRMHSGRWYCLKITVHETIRKGWWALPPASWNSDSVVNLMEGDLDTTQAILLDHTIAILYIRWCSASKGSMEERLKPVWNILALMSNGGVWESNGTSKPSQ